MDNDEWTLGHLIDQLVKAKAAIEAGGFTDPDETRVLVRRINLMGGTERNDLTSVTVEIQMVGTEDPLVIIA